MRAKAREAWRAYIEGPAPKPAPMKKLVLPGGKLTKKEKPLWLTYRELADNELRKYSNELLGTDYIIKDPTLDDSDAEIEHPKKVPAIDQKAVTKELFDYYDKQRAEQEAKQWTEAEAKAKSGDTAGAVPEVDDERIRGRTQLRLRGHPAVDASQPVRRRRAPGDRSDGVRMPVRHRSPLAP